MKRNGNVQNELKLTLPALSINEGIARAAVGAFVSGLNPTLEELADIKCALSEAVTNCIVHAYRHVADEQVGEIYIAVTCYRDRRVKITVRDEGCGIEDVEAARAPLFTTASSEERSGMGFSVMEHFTDRVRVWSVPGRGTKITLLKLLRA